MHSADYMMRLWDLGQQHLAAGRYVPARTALQTAEKIAFQKRDPQSLARIYLPLLEARRLIRYHAAEGQIIIGDATIGDLSQKTEGGTLLLTRAGRTAEKIAQKMSYESRRTGRWWEVLMMVRRGSEARLVSAGDPFFAAGLQVQWMSTEPTGTPAAVGESTDEGLRVPLPPPGTYDGRKGVGGGTIARESLLVAWEALALKWQRRHPLGRHAGPWDEIAWLRQALQVDPACEPVTMRLMAVAETGSG